MHNQKKRATADLVVYFGVGLWGNQKESDGRFSGVRWGWVVGVAWCADEDGELRKE